MLTGSGRIRPAGAGRLAADLRLATDSTVNADVHVHEAKQRERTNQVNTDINSIIFERQYYLDRSTIGEATITEVVLAERPHVRLNSTLFHPQGGGQRADVGTIDGVPVLEVAKGDGEAVLHYVSDGSHFKPGQRVNMAVDQLNRARNSALHTAGHLIAGLVERIAPQLKAVQGHHWPGEARVEFSAGFNDIPQLERVLGAHLHDAIESDAAVLLAFEPPAGRRVTIAGFSAIPCGGTHVSSLSQLGEVQLRSIKVKSGRLRIGYEVIVPAAVLSA
jgi:alanyl-tRNA synthetase